MTILCLVRDNRLLLKAKAQQVVDLAERGDADELTLLAGSVWSLARSISILTEQAKPYLPPPAYCPDYPVFQGG